MYKICYQAFAPQSLAYFNDYNDCKKALDILKEKYPDAKIWMHSVTPVCFDEFMDKTGGLIDRYENSIT